MAAFKHLWDTNEEFRNAMTAIWEGIVKKIQAFVEGIKERLAALNIDFTAVAKYTEKNLEMVSVKLLAPVFEAAFSIISTVLGTVFDVLTGLLDVFIGLFTGTGSRCGQGSRRYSPASGMGSLESLRQH